MSDWKTSLLALVGTALASACAWALSKLWAYLQAKATNEVTKGAVQLAQEVVASVVAHSVALRAAVMTAGSDLLNGKWTQADVDAIKANALATLKATYPDVLSSLEKILGNSSSAIETYFSGLVVRYLSQQSQAQAAAAPAAAPSLVDPIAAKIGQAAAALTAAKPANTSTVAPKVP